MFGAVFTASWAASFGQGQRAEFREIVIWNRFQSHLFGVLQKHVLEGHETTTRTKESPDGK